MKKLFLILISGIVILTACKKDDEKDKTALLCDKDWKLSAWTAKFSHNTQTITLDVFADPAQIGLPNCILDDLINFDIDGTYTTKPGAISCNITWFGGGDWVFSANDAVLKMKNYNDTLFRDYNINTLNETKLDITTVERIDIIFSRKTLSMNPDEFTDVTFNYIFEH